MRKLTIAAIAYATIAVMTFGYAAAKADVRYNAHCATLDQRNNAPIDECYGVGTPTMGGFMAGLFWPFYWSWELQS